MTRLKPVDAFVIQRRMMTRTGVWPNANPDIFYKLHTASSWFFGVSMFAMLSIEFIHDIKDFTKLSESLYILLAYFAYLTKLSVFMYNRKKVTALTNFLENPIFTSHSDDLNHYMERSIRTTNFIATILQYSLVALILLYVVYPILDHVPLPFPVPYDFGKFRYVVFVYQLIGHAYASWNHSSIDTLCVALMSLGAAQLDILASKLTHFKEEQERELESNEDRDKKDEASVEYLKECVRHHLAIIKFIETIEDIFTVGLLAQFVASTIMICNTLFYFVLIPFSSEFAMLTEYIVIIICQLFMYCWYGNRIMLKSQQIADACYMSNWHLCNNKVRKYIFIIMERSKRPLTITTLKLSTLTLAAFLAILRWSYSLLTLLLKMYDKQSGK